MIDYYKNSDYDHNRAVVQHIRGLCEKYNVLISKEFDIETFNLLTAEIRSACNMAKTCGHEIRLFQLDSFDISPIVIIWAHDTTTGEIMKSSIWFISEYGERVCLKHGYQVGTFRPYYLKREFNFK